MNSKKEYKKPEMERHGTLKNITAGSSPPIESEPDSFAKS
jgi:hypothetical protein